jgi:hypothetical protein
VRWVVITIALGLAVVPACGGDDSSDARSTGGDGGGGAAGSGASGGSGGGLGGDASVGLEGALDAAGFTVQSGSFAVIDIADCCDEGKSCSGNNPTSPYGAFYIPRAPGQTVANPNEGSNGLSTAYRLSADEAVVYVGTTPPAAKYFGFTPYLMDKADATGVRKPVFASLSETLNNGVVLVDGSSPFSSPFALIATADAETESKVRSALVAAGVSASSINTLVFDPALAGFGIEEASDTFGVLFRVALFDDDTKGDAYLDALPGTLLRVTPKTSATPAPLPSPLPRTKNTSNTEAALGDALDELQAAVIAANAPTPKSLVITPGTPDPVTCIQNLSFCAGDNRDTIYPGTLPRILFAAPEDYYVVIGVNHTALNKTSYSSFSVYAIDHLVGVASVTSKTYAGSASDYLPNHPNVDDLYAWKVARDCGTDPHCLAIPDAGCPTGVGAGKFGTITFRAYLEPGTFTAPDPATLVQDRVIYFAAN